uniref:Lipoprotein n=1 Tax=Romanomermis culicivorax TaxID=13658 RepID=A0A915K6Q6_ROMCU
MNKVFILLCSAVIGCLAAPANVGEGLEELALKTAGIATGPVATKSDVEAISGAVVSGERDSDKITREELREAAENAVIIDWENERIPDKVKVLMAVIHPPALLATLMAEKAREIARNPRSPSYTLSESHWEYPNGSFMLHLTAAGVVQQTTL